MASDLQLGGDGSWAVLAPGWGDSEIAQNVSDWEGLVLGWGDVEAPFDESPEIQRLESEVAWYKTLNLLYDFAGEFGRLPTRADSAYRGVDLGGWIGQQCDDRHALPSDRFAALGCVPGWRWEAPGRGPSGRPLPPARAKGWQKNFELLKAYVEAFGQLPPKRGCVYLGVDLGRWVANQRRAIKRDGGRKLAPDRIAALESVPGWHWSGWQEMRWERNFETLGEYVAEFNRLPPWKNCVYRGISLSHWILNQRKTKRRGGRLPPERMSALEGIPGWHW
jgi:hypothetical protein